jgi:predicted secreted protein
VGIEDGQRGFQCQLTLGGATIGLAQDVDLESSKGEVPTTNRGSGGWKEILPGIGEWNAPAKALWVPTNAGLQAIINAYLAGTKLAATFLDAFGYGFSGNCYVMTLKRGEALEDAVTVECGLTGTGALSYVAGSS